MYFRLSRKPKFTRRKAPESNPEFRHSGSFRRAGAALRWHSVLAASYPHGGLVLAVRKRADLELARANLVGGSSTQTSLLQPGPLSIASLQNVSLMMSGSGKTTSDGLVAVPV